MNEFLKCLIIEDDAAMVYIIKIELSNYGFRVAETHVENAVQMKKAVTHQEFDVIISDHNMPSFSSLDALGIRNQLCGKTPFLIFTNDLTDSARSAAMQNGCSQVIKKEDVLLLPKTIEQLTCKTIK